MNNTIISIVATECRHAAEKETTLDDRIAAAMNVAKDHYLTTDNDERFRGAIAAIYELSDEETRYRIKEEMDALKYLSAMLSDVSVNLDAMPKIENPIGLIKTWGRLSRCEQSTTVETSNQK